MHSGITCKKIEKRLLFEKGMNNSGLNCISMWGTAPATFDTMDTCHVLFSLVQFVSDRGMSPKGKTPYIMLNGEKMADSQLCIEFLNKKFNVDLDKTLSSEERAVSRAFRKMIEESFYW